jgi:hypothetical protein
MGADAAAIGGQPGGPVGLLMQLVDGIALGESGFAAGELLLSVQDFDAHGAFLDRTAMP